MSSATLAALPAELPAAAALLGGLLGAGGPQRGPLGLRPHDAVAVTPSAAPAALHAERVARHVLPARSALRIILTNEAFLGGNFGSADHSLKVVLKLEGCKGQLRILL